jgi:L-ascorbate metabolism protein UlaG (beta-lactamase superfamily)
VLLSHDHHADNFDDSGRELTSRVASVFTTSAGAERLGNGAIGLADYESATVPLPDGRELTITGVPAHHGPDGLWEAVGPVIGFVLSGEGLPTVYVSGDNSSLELVEEISEKFSPIDIAILFAGGAKFDEIMDGAFLTLTNEAVLDAAKILDPATIIPVHAEGWAHFSQSAHQLRDAFEEAGVGNRIVVVEPGASVQLDL